MTAIDAWPIVFCSRCGSACMTCGTPIPRWIVEWRRRWDDSPSDQSADLALFVTRPARYSSRDIASRSVMASELGF